MTETSEPAMTISDLHDDLRPRAFAIAYRMLGSVSDAEDVVQDAFLKMHQALQRGEEIRSPQAYISTLVTRRAIDQLRSARARREQYVGEWLPEPVAIDSPPDEQVATADSLSLAFLVVLESLTPAQRAAFLLHEVFDYPYDEVAGIIGTSVDSARHLVSRARAHVRERRPRYETSRSQMDELAQRFFAAAQRGDLAALEELLAEDVSLHADGGGKVPAQRQPIFGREKVAKLLAAGIATLARRQMRLEIVTINGQPGAIAIDPTGHLYGTMSLDILDGHIHTIHSIANPDKLRHLRSTA